MDTSTFNRQEMRENHEILFSSDKDFYKGGGGELRLKAEGLFKKAKEKGISIEEVDIVTIRDNEIDFPGVGVVELPTFVVKVKGRHVESGQVMLDGKQIDYYNRYQKYVAEKIQSKNLMRDDKGRTIRENGRMKVKAEIEMSLTEWERFDICKRLIEDKEFGMEKTITGACDRVIRKLMGENDWLYPEEARLLDEEFVTVQKKIEKAHEEIKPGCMASNAAKRNDQPVMESMPRKATERQISYLKARIKNMGLNPEDEKVFGKVLKKAGFGEEIERLTTQDVSKIIDILPSLVPKVKEMLSKEENPI